MENNHGHIYQAARVILIILKNEGAMKDDWDYPEDFQKAFQKLLFLDVIKNKNGWYVPGKNFREVCRAGIQKFTEQEKGSSEGKVFPGEYVIGILTGTVIAGISYLILSQKKS
jgi:hypothetical protein